MTGGKNKETWEDLKSAKDLSELAILLKLKSGSSLSYVLYHMEAKENKPKYSSFEIAKKNGGTRTINAPYYKLKSIQKCLAKLLEEITNSQKNTIMAHGFKKNYSIFTNAEVHKNKEYVLNFDIKDFFPSFNFGRVRGFFISKGVNDKVATAIAQIACYDDKAKGKHALPQGSPCSPIISNIMAHEFLDLPLMKIAQKHGCDYSRYADDITLSTNEENFPHKIAFLSLKKKKNWVMNLLKKKKFWTLNPYIEKKISKRGFKINPDKTRMQYKSNQQIVTGLVVNEKVNVRRTYFKTARAMVHSLLKYDDFYIPGTISPIDATDNIADDDLQEPPSMAKKMKKLEGNLSHIYHIKLQASIEDHYLLTQYNRLDKIFKKKMTRKDNILSHIKKFVSGFLNRVKVRTDTEISKNCKAIKKMYEDFLFYKYFSFSEPNKAIIFFEGVTDKDHIKSALKKLQKRYPEIIKASLKKGRKTYAYSFLFPQFSKMARLFFNISDGGGIKELTIMVDYYGKKSTDLKSEKYSNLSIKYPKLSFGIPVIFVVDNDSGGEDFFKSMIKKNSNLKNNLTLNNDKDCYFEICENLYIVKLPHQGEETEVAIEDLYKDHTSKILNVKKADKVKFAAAVAKNTKHVSFSRFIPLLDRIDKTIKDHYEKQQKQT